MGVCSIADVDGGRWVLGIGRWGRVSLREVGMCGVNLLFWVWSSLESSVFFFEVGLFV